MDIYHIILKSYFYELTAEEQQFLDQWLDEGDHAALYARICRHFDDMKDPVQYMASIDVETALQEVRAKSEGGADVQPSRAKTLPLKRWMAAAGVAAAVVASAFLLWPSTGSVKPHRDARLYAYLVNEQGDSLFLDSTTTSLSDRDVTISVTGSAIALSQDASAHGSRYYTLHVPRGKSYNVTLSDGTHVRVNAMSTMRFPASFGQLATRTVELTGEARYEVAKDKQHPFIVHTAQHDVVVTGTIFNVQAYPGETFKTTLTQGGVTVTMGSQPNVKLTPGQQLVVTESGETAVKEVETQTDETDEQGLYTFDGQSIDEIMLTLSRWYNIEGVSYEGVDLQKRRFSGKLKQEDGLKTILHIIEIGTDTEIELQNNRIIIKNRG